MLSDEQFLRTGRGVLGLVPASLLGHVHGLIGGGDQAVDERPDLGCGDRFRGDAGHPDAGRDPEWQSSNGDKQRFGQFDRLVLAERARDCELLSSESGDGRASTNIHAAQQLPDLGQYAISVGVAVRVVDVLEPVQIGDQNADKTAVQGVGALLECAFNAADAVIAAGAKRAIVLGIVGLPQQIERILEQRQRAGTVFDIADDLLDKSLLEDHAVSRGRLLDGGAQAGDPLQLALVFERPSLDGREGFQEVGSETLVAVMAPDHPVLLAAGDDGLLREAHLIDTRQIVVASRDRAITDPRVVFARQVWRTDAPEAALSLIKAGLGWGWLPRSFVRASLLEGTLRELPFDNLTNALELWVDVVWSKERPLGLGARRFIEMMRAVRPGAAGAASPAQAASL